MLILKDTPMYHLYQRFAPHPEDFPQLLTKMGEAMSKDFDFSKDVRSVQVPTLIVAADADMAPPSTTLRYSNCSMVASETHHNIFSSPLFAEATLASLG
jgi:hypothetical protein